LAGRIARLAQPAQPAEVLVSRTVRDLVTGTGLSFTERGRHELTGLPDEWPLFAVAPGDQAVRPARR
jgi:class 3 adenylate cyclase